MTARRLLLLAATVLAGYGLGWADRAYGHAPILLLTLVALVSWLAGYGTAALPLHDKLAEANRRITQLENAPRTVLAHPSVRAKVYGVKNWPAR